MPEITEEQIREALAAFDLSNYLTEIGKAGRAGVSSATRGEAARLYERICAFSDANSSVSRELDDVLTFARRVLLAEWFLSRAKAPNYRAYANIGVLNWYLHTDRRATYQDIWRRCAVAIQALLQDLIAFEVKSLAGVEPRGSDSYDERAVRDRVARLRAVESVFDGEPGQAMLSRTGRPMTLTSCVQESHSTSTLVTFTALPQTVEHDEYLFLRTIHISECCFWAILTASLAAGESLKRKRMKVAKDCLSVALPFAELLTPLFQALKTMSPEHFRRFRDATGDASAVQSRAYQLMQIALSGVNPNTIQIVTGFDDLQNLASYDQPDFASLVRLSDSDEASGPPRAPTLSRELTALRRELYKWRTLHLGIARKYLADIPEGTGGTTGPLYLKRSVRDGSAPTPSSTQCSGRHAPSHDSGDPLGPSDGPKVRAIPGSYPAQPILTSAN
jgi:tryptophan 2,3-dioxygenase